MTFAESVREIVERQGTTLYVSLALGELGLKTVQQVTHVEHFLRRVAALEEENRG